MDHGGNAFSLLDVKRERKRWLASIWLYYRREEKESIRRLYLRRSMGVWGLRRPWCAWRDWQSAFDWSNFWLPVSPYPIPVTGTSNRDEKREREKERKLGYYWETGKKLFCGANDGEILLRHRLQLWSVRTIDAGPHPRKEGIQPIKCTKWHLIKRRETGMKTKITSAKNRHQRKLASWPASNVNRDIKCWQARQQLR